MYISCAQFAITQLFLIICRHIIHQIKVRLWVLKQDHPLVHVFVDISLVP